MSDVRANPGVPVLAQFGGTDTPTACAPLIVDSTTGDIYSLKTGDVVTKAGAAGGVVGPASSTDNHVVFFSGTTGKLIKDSGLTLSGTNTGDQTNISGNAATVTTNANLTGPITSVGNATSIASGNTYPTPIFTGPVTEAPRAATWQFANWNPSDVAGTETAPSDTPTASLTATNYMTMASSSGTLTYTFTKAGNYLISFLAYITSAGIAYTSFYARLILGGTATRYLTPTSLYNQAIDADSGKSVWQGISFLIAATANQTVTIAPKVAATSGSAASNFTMSAAATACYMGT